MAEICAIILAAGESKRMGSPKMLLPFNGSTMLESVIANVSASEIAKIIVVLGADKEALVQLLGKLHISYCYNENFKEGMLSSVQCGFRNLPQEINAALVFQGDQPLITRNAINPLIEAYLLSGKGIVIPVYNLKRGHPILIDIKYRKEIEKLTPDEGLHMLSARFPEDVIEIETSESGILRDFDTYKEYMKGINQIH